VTSGRPRAAIGLGRHGGGVDRHRAQRGGRDVVGTRDQAGPLAQRRQRDAARPQIADIGGAHRQEAALFVQRQLDPRHQIASLVVGEKRLRARRGVFDRAADFFGRPQGQAEFDEDPVAGAEIAADVVGQDAQPLRRDAENRRELALLAHRAAAAGMQRVAAGRGVVLGNRGARLERHAGHPADMEVLGDDVIGRRKRLVGRRAIAEPGVDRDVVRHLVPQRRRARLHGVLRMQHVGKGLVVDRDRLGGIERLGGRLGHHHGDRFADMARLVGGQQHMRSDEYRLAAGGGQLHVVFCLGQGIVRDRGELVGEAIGAGEDPEHARHGARACRVDPEDAGVRVGRAHHRGKCLARELEVVAEAALAGHQARVLVARDRLADEAVMRLVGFQRVLHAANPRRGLKR